MVEQADSSSSIKLKPKFQNYKGIRRKYDSRIIEMVMSNGKYIFVQLSIYIYKEECLSACLSVRYAFGPFNS